MNPRVKSVVPQEDFRLEITFENKEQGIYDCKPLLNHGVFEELKDRSYFRKARTVDGTVAWPHDQDICPDTLYMDSMKLHSKVACRIKRFGRSRPTNRASKRRSNRA
ncbi:MAG: DUF2442 domain-containing protein [Elusimicrobia bacterium]|nr:DUF2442 domain-containing protein [Elusimicrobiota bacterium]